MCFWSGLRHVAPDEGRAAPVAKPAKEDGHVLLIQRFFQLLLCFKTFRGILRLCPSRTPGQEQPGAVPEAILPVSEAQLQRRQQLLEAQLLGEGFESEATRTYRLWVCLTPRSGTVHQARLTHTHILYARMCART